MDASIYYQSGYSDYFHPAFLSQIHKEDISTIFEVGAANGKDTIFLNAYYQADVFAFECDPRMLSLCRNTVRGRPGIRLIEAAAWHEDTILKFFPVIENVVNGQKRDINGRSSLFKARPDYIETYIQSEIYVPAIRLSDFCKTHQIDKIDLLCMDVQGAGKQVLEGLGDCLRHVHYLIIEMEYKAIYFGQSLVSDIDPILCDFGFERKAEVQKNSWFSDFLYINNQYEHVHRR